MWCLWIGMLTFVTALGPTDELPRSQYEALVNEYDTTWKAYTDALTKATTDADREKAAGNRPLPQNVAERFFALAKKYPDDPAAIDALTWIASHYMFITEGTKALRILASEFSRSDQLAAYIGVSSRYGEPSAPYEELLRAILKNNPHPEMQVSACAALAVYLKMAKERSEMNLVRISLSGRQFMLPETSWNLDRLMERGLDNVAAESETLFERLVKQYGDVRLKDCFPHEAGAFAKQQLFELKNLSIGKKALEIEGKDISGTAMKLSDYHGKVVVLDFGSHRMCGVCRAMYPELRRIVKQFDGKPFALIGINAGDHISELKDLTKTGEITWRLLWDGDEVEGPISSRWVIRSMPTLYVLDHTGVIRNKGFLDSNDIVGTAEMLLKEMTAKKP